MEKYKMVWDIGSGNFGTLMRNKEIKVLVSGIYIERGHSRTRWTRIWRDYPPHCSTMPASSSLDRGIKEGCQGRIVVCMWHRTLALNPKNTLLPSNFGQQKEIYVCFERNGEGKKIKPAGLIMWSALGKFQIGLDLVES